MMASVFVLETGLARTVPFLSISQNRPKRNLKSQQLIRHKAKRRPNYKVRKTPQLIIQNKSLLLMRLELITKQLII